MLRLACHLFLALLLLSAAPGRAEEERYVFVVVNRASIGALDQKALRAIFSMRLHSWEDGSKVHVFVLPDSDATHRQFVREILRMYTHQLRRSWDRAIYSGMGEAPQVVSSEKEMIRRLLNNPGAIGETVARVRLPGYEADLDSRYIGLARVSIGSDVGSWKLAYTFGKTALDFSTSAPIQLLRGQVREAINLLSGEYLLEEWIFTAEYQQLETWSRAERVPAVLGTSESWYLQSAWLFRPKWRALLRLDQYQPDRDSGNMRTRDLVLGLRYDYDNHWMAAIEYHKVEGIAWLSPADNTEVAEPVNDWQLLAAVVSYRF